MHLKSMIDRDFSSPWMRSTRNRKFRREVRRGLRLYSLVNSQWRGCRELYAIWSVDIWEAGWEQAIVGFGMMQYAEYAVLSACCTRCMLYSVYAVLGVCCTGCMLFLVLTLDLGMER
jgi:hypothetical protein